MAKIKNDPKRYVKRSTLGGHRVTACVKNAHKAFPRTKRDFLTAKIDSSTFYVDFRERNRQHGR